MRLTTTRLTALTLAALFAACGAGLASRAIAGTPMAMPVAPSATLLPTPQPTARVIIKYRPEAAADGAPASASASRQARRIGGAQAAAARVGQRLQWLRAGALGTEVMQLERPLPLDEVQRLADEIAAADPSVAYAEPDRIWVPQTVPNDIQYGQQWSYFEARAGLNLPAAWDKSTGTGVVLAVVDTGFLPHADLAANLLPGHDFIGDTTVAADGDGRDADARDPGDAVTAGQCGSPTGQASSWHGTHVAGLIAAVTHNGQGVAGVAHGARVVPVRALGKCGGYTSDIADGIVWASGGTVDGVPANAHPARVINLSVGGNGACDNTSRAAIAAARSRGAVVVAAAGNDNDNAANFTPANCDGVIAVTATDRRGDRAYYANLGATVALAAPGGDVRASAADGILSTFNTGASGPGADSYGAYQGTSMAAPQVAGVVALMLSVNPMLTPDEVLVRLKASARRFPGACPLCGAGLVDALAAVDAALVDAPVSAVPEVEPNFRRALAQPVARGTTVAGHLGTWLDVDVYRVTVPAGERLTARLVPNESSDYDLYAFNAQGWLVAGSHLGTGLEDKLALAHRGSGPATYYLRVFFHRGGTGASAGTYRLAVD